MRDDVARSLSAHAELAPYLPELLRDLWPLGCSPEPLLRLLARSPLANASQRKVLDLGCGKGAALIRLAETFGWRGQGIDLVPEFLEEARRRAQDHGVDALVDFHVIDITQALRDEQRVDLILFGVDGPGPEELDALLQAMKGRLHNPGYVALDLVWRRAECANLQVAPSESDVHRTVAAGGFAIEDEERFDSSWVHQQNAWNTARIRERAAVLAERHPAMRARFDAYVRQQEAESRELEEDVVCAWLLLSPQRLRGEA